MLLLIIPLNTSCLLHSFVLLFTRTMACCNFLIAIDRLKGTLLCSRFKFMYSFSVIIHVPSSTLVLCISLRVFNCSCTHLSREPKIYFSRFFLLSIPVLCHQIRILLFLLICKMCLVHLLSLFPNFIIIH